MKACPVPNRRLDGTEELRKMGFGLRVHANDDNEGDEAVVRDDLRLLHRPRAPRLDTPSH